MRELTEDLKPFQINMTRLCQYTLCCRLISVRAPPQTILVYSITDHFFATPLPQQIF